MRSINLLDGSFSHQTSLSLGGMNSAEPPSLMQWDRSCRSPGLTVYTDMHLGSATRHPRDNNIALLVEPPSLHDGHYHTAFRMWLRGYFKRVLSPFQFSHHFTHYDLGGSWISLDHWHLRHDKPHFCSIIISQKTGAAGHKLRRQVYNALGDYLELFGRWKAPIENKLPALAPFQYSVVIESCRVPGYFSEKLIDCLSVGTIPLYWGDPTIDRHFSGLPTWESISQLDTLLRDPPVIAADLISQWHATASTLRCAEDNLITKGLFA